MFINYLKISLRNLVVHKGYNIIRIAGLAVGMTVFILIFLFVQYELSVDTFHQNYDTLYRVESDLIISKDKHQYQAVTPCPAAPVLREEFPEIKEVVRITPSHLSIADFTSSTGTKVRELHGTFADNSIFRAFTFPLSKGNEETALTQPYTIVLTEELSKKYFPEGNALGKKIRITSKQTEADYTVTGVLRPLPARSHIQFRYIMSFPSYLEIIDTNTITNWGLSSVFTYVMIPAEYSWQDVNKKIRNVLMEKGEVTNKKLYLKKFSDLYLRSESVLSGGLGPTGNEKYVLLFSLIAVFILLIAGINFINLTTAFSVYRAKEIGVRKVAGATRATLILQFLGESFVISFISICVAMALSEILLGTFKNLVARDLVIDYTQNLQLLLVLFPAAIFITLFSGSYPAFFLASLKPTDVLRNMIKTKNLGLILRKVLVVFQFVISIALIISTFIIFKQVDYMENKDLGFRKNQLVISLTEIKNKTAESCIRFKKELLANKNILAAGYTGSRPFHRTASTSAGWEDGGDKRTITYFYGVEPDYFDVFDLEILEQMDEKKILELAGPDYSSIVGLINETALKTFGWKKPLGKEVYFKYFKVTVVGVFRDYHHYPLKDAIRPMILALNLNNVISEHRSMSVKVVPENIPDTLDFIKNKFNEIFPGNYCELYFLDKQLNKVYVEEEHIGKILGYFSALAIIIASLGLVGLASYSSKKRAKEICIRKIYGAGLTNILALLAKEYSILMVFANIIAWPVAYIAMDNWLDHFAYRIDIGVWPFVITCLISFAAAILTVSFQAVKMVLTNPVETLKYE